LEIEGWGADCYSKAMQQSGNAAGSRSLRFRCRGHRNIRALHHKTLEIIRGAEISERATCVVGVGADYDPRSVALLSGPVELRLEVAGTEEVVAAEVSSFPSTEEGLVFRLSQVSRGNTFAVGADRGARDLSRGLAQALSAPETLVEVSLREKPLESTSTGALFVLLMDRGELPTREERRALLASSVVLGPRVAQLRPWIRDLEPIVEVLPLLGQKDGGHQDDPIFDLLAKGKRASLGVTLDDLAGESDPGGVSAPRALISAAMLAGIPVSCVSEVSPWLRALVVSGISPRPSLLCGRVEGRNPARSLASRARGERTLVWWAREKELCRGLEAVAELRGHQAPALVARDPGGLKELFVAGNLEHCCATLRRLSLEEGSATGAGPEWVAVVGAQVLAGESSSDGLPEPGLLRALLAAEVPVKTLARAVASTADMAKRDAYRALLALQGAAEEEE